MKKLRSTTARLGLSVGLIASMLAVTSPATAQESPLPDLPTAAVAMGDSFISGEGASQDDENYDAVRDINGVLQPNPGYKVPLANNDNAFFCHRSPNASIEVADLPGIDERINIACSGGVTADIADRKPGEKPRKGSRQVASQISQLKEVAKTHDIDLVLVGLGANNVGFSPVAGNCIGKFVTDAYVGWWEGWTNLNWDLKIAGFAWIPDIRWIHAGQAHNTTTGACGAADFPGTSDFEKGRADLEEATRLILETMAEIDPDGEHKIVFQDYVNPLPENIHDEFKSQNHRNDTRDKFRALARERYGAGCPIHQATLPHAQTMTSRIGEMIAGVHDQMLREFPNADLVYLNVQEAFDGARLCENADSPKNTLHTPVRARTGSGKLVTSFHGKSLGDIATLFDDCESYFQLCQESLHPNKDGQAILGICLGNTWKASSLLVDCVRRNGNVSTIQKNPAVEVTVAASYYETLSPRGQAILDLSGNYSAKVVNAPGLSVRSVRVTARNSQGTQLGTQTGMHGAYSYQLRCGQLDLNLQVSVEVTLSDGQVLRGNGSHTNSISCGGARGGGDSTDNSGGRDGSGSPKKRDGDVPVA